jgi:hypothetical protein
MPAEEQVEAVSAKLKDLNPGFDGEVGHKIEDGVIRENNATGLALRERQVAHAGIGSTRSRRFLTFSA